VLADAHGHVVHIGERECSLQRRHQKIVEEAPSPLLTPEVRAAMGQQAVDAALACGYAGAGTVEFIVSSDQPDEFFFLEMNTRLQVEHPVTEMVYRIDLVEWQLRVAAGEVLPFEQAALQPNGHAVEVRVYAEDPARGFLPTGGRVLALREPVGDGVRVDSGIAAGSVIGSDYDPMLAKVIAWGGDRAEALHRLDHALGDTAVLGITTNVGFLRRLLSDPDVATGRLDTGLVERRLDALVHADVPVAALAAVAIEPLMATGARPDAWSQLVAWRHGRPAATRRELDVAGHGPVVTTVCPIGRHDGTGPWTLSMPDDTSFEVTVRDDGDSGLRLTIDGHVVHVTRAIVGRTTHLALGGDAWAITDVEQRGAGGPGAGSHGDGVVRSPMPGTVIAVHVAVGDAVAKGQAVAVVEAMKMEHSVTAPFDGTIGDVHAAVGASVALDAPVVTVVAVVGVVGAVGAVATDIPQAT
jgi:acetyl-CoA/propionyl-CoA carboxylase biotin carboxyl carrier protein